MLLMRRKKKKRRGRRTGMAREEKDEEEGEEEKRTRSRNEIWKGGGGRWNRKEWKLRHQIDGLMPGDSCPASQVLIVIKDVHFNARLLAIIESRASRVVSEREGQRRVHLITQTSLNFTFLANNGTSILLLVSTVASCGL